MKRLSAVEANVLRSNQHEFNSSNQLKKLLGTPDRVQYRATFIWLGGEQDALTEEAFLTWYESRKPPRSEHRLYFPTNAVCSVAAEGDTLIIAKRTDDSLMAIIVPAGSTVHNQLLWLFGVDDQPSLKFEAVEISKDNDAELDFAARYILDELGIEPEEPEADRLDSLIEKFGLKFPPTRVLSGLARMSLPEVNAKDGPDEALVLWMEREEQLFRRLERRIVAERIREGFATEEAVDVDGFLGFSLSVQNRRKARAGAALENHLAAIFDVHEIRYARGVETENRNRPDFLFPGQTEYQDPTFPTARLTMLGAKSTLKDRWRQVLSEAARIDQKHLITLEPGISENQTNEMRAKALQLVLPEGLHDTFKPAQREWLMDVSGFLRLAVDRQA
ncbi:type II restriction endonuclease [Phyllobacterium phragmitis]|uniref:Type II restriction endonuclease n=1 Tax=Phyllobacterium phragmitis TaxID=2670329 RepID=A0ABQ0H1Z5_9HYPH